MTGSIPFSPGEDLSSVRQTIYVWKTNKVNTYSDAPPMSRGIHYSILKDEEILAPKEQLGLKEDQAASNTPLPQRTEASGPENRSFKQQACEQAKENLEIAQKMKDSSGDGSQSKLSKIYQEQVSRYCG
ncbi:MAG: hypothetical protein WDW20_05250 [Neisseriaceae bacterium]